MRRPARAVEVRALVVGDVRVGRLEVDVALWARRCGGVGGGGVGNDEEGAGGGSEWEEGSFLHMWLYSLVKGSREHEEEKKTINNTNKPPQRTRTRG